MPHRCGGRAAPAPAPAGRAPPPSAPTHAQPRRTALVAPVGRLSALCPPLVRRWCGTGEAVVPHQCGGRAAPVPRASSPRSCGTGRAASHRSSGGLRRKSAERAQPQVDSPQQVGCRLEVRCSGSQEQPLVHRLLQHACGGRPLSFGAQPNSRCSRARPRAQHAARPRRSTRAVVRRAVVVAHVSPTASSPATST